MRLGGVRPSIACASAPTATSWPLAVFTATMEGSFQDDAATGYIHICRGGSQINRDVGGYVRPARIQTFAIRHGFGGTSRLRGLRQLSPNDARDVNV